MDNPPLLSVIIPVYNAEKYLRRCLDSLIGQTLRDIEIICIDDGSKDGSFDILSEYRNKDPRIRVVRQENQGTNPARNLGLRMARGTYLAILDADDFFDLTMLEESSRILEAENSDIVVFPAYTFSDRTGKILFRPGSLRTDYLPEECPFAPVRMSSHLFNAFQNWTWNKVFRKSFIDREGIIFQNVKRTTDMAFTCEALVKAGSISVIRKPLVYYRIDNDQSLQETKHEYPYAFWDAFVETQRRIKAAGVYDIYEQSFLNWVLAGAFYNMNTSKTEGGRLYAFCLLKYRGEETFGFLNHGRDYYYDPTLYDEYVKILKIDSPDASMNDLRKKIDQMQQYNDDLLNSTAFRIGSVLTFIPGTIKRNLRSFLKNKKQQKIV